MKHKLLNLWHRLKHLVHSHKKTSTVIGIVLILGFIWGGFSLWSGGQSEQVSRTEPNSQAAEEEEIKIVPSPLSGLSVEEHLAKRPVTAFVIENSPNARPQSGLHQAGVVFEAIAEGGITRFVAFYQENRPDMLGPIRSLRPYYIDWVLAFDAGIGHVGGSAQALAEARQVGLKDLDQFAHGGSYVRTTDRFAPHNVYTDFDKIDALNERLGFTSSTFYSWPRKDDSPLTTPKATSISVPISSYLYNPEFTWNADQNNYRRSQAGEAHNDRETGERLRPKVVIVIRSSYSIASDGRYSYDLIGSGTATIFQDGDAIAGSWSKPQRDSMMRFLDANGDEIPLNRGQVWISAIAPDKGPEFSP